MAFMALLLLHSFVTLNAFGGTVAGVEWLLLIWFISLAVEEMRQVRASLSTHSDRSGVCACLSWCNSRFLVPRTYLDLQIHTCTLL